MNILVINAGSSSVKFALFGLETLHPTTRGSLTWSGDPRCATITLTPSTGGESGEVVCRDLGDVGYGDGNFLSKAKSVVQDCFGYDIPPVFPLPQGVKRIDNITGAYYDVVTFYNSLEHMPELDFLQKIQCKYLVVTVPWCHYFSEEWFLSME